MKPKPKQLVSPIYSNSILDMFSTFDFSDSKVKVVGGLDDAFQQQTQLQKSFLPISAASSFMTTSSVKCLLILFFQILANH